MSNSLNTFPENYQEALAILYMQNQDLKGKTPEEMVSMYNDTLKAMYAQSKKMWEEERNEKYDSQ